MKLQNKCGTRMNEGINMLIYYFKLLCDLFFKKNYNKASTCNIRMFEYNFIFL